MLLYCDVCDKAYHTFCLKPKLATVPSCGWRCHDCFKCTKCGTTSFFKNRDDYFASKNIDYSISKDFTFCIECSIEEYHRNSSEQKCEKCGEKLKYTSDDLKSRECLNCLIKNKKCNSKVLARENCECYLNIHQISTRHKLLSFLCRHTLEPFLSKFGNTFSTLIKHFVNDNIDFFREDIVIMEWLHVLEMGVKFENEETELTSSRGPHRKMITNFRSESQSPEKRMSRSHSEMKGEDSNAKNSVAKYSEMSKRIGKKLGRRKRKYQKKQIEFIGWHYEEIKEARIRDLINVISLMPSNKESEQFYEYLFNTAYMQLEGKPFDEANYEIVQNIVAPVLLHHGRPILLNHAVKCLLLFKSYYTLCTPLLEVSYDAFYNLIRREFNYQSSIENSRVNYSPWKFTYFNETSSSNQVRPDVRSLMVLDSYKELVSESEPMEVDEDPNQDFLLTTEALFLPTTPFPSDFRIKGEAGDVEMKADGSEDGNEESKMVTPTKAEAKYSSQPLRSEKEINFRQWGINLRDKLNLNKYTKTLHMGKSLLKHRMNEHKETFLPKSYTPFMFSSQQMYKIIKPEEPEKIMREINLDQSFEVDYVELLTKYEFPAVLRLKKKFMTWFCKYMHDKIQQKKKDLEERKLQKEEEERLKKMKEEEEADMKARKDNLRVEPVVPKAKIENYRIHNIDEIDPLEDNPSKVLQCAFCLRKGQRKLSGRLIPFRANQFIHVNCALWTDNVFDDKEGHILNFYFSYKKSRLTKCSLCNELGASISCERAK